MGAAAPVFTVAMGAAQYKLKVALVNIINQLQIEMRIVLEGQAAQIEQKAEFDIAQFQKDFRKMEGETTVALAKSGVELGTGSAYNIELSNAYEAKLQENLIKYNSQVAANNKMEEANFARIRGTMARNEAKMAQIGTVASTGSLLYGMKNNNAKNTYIYSKGSIEQLAGTTSNIQMGLNNTLASALAPVTQAIVNFKIKENNVQNRTEALKLKNDYLSVSLALEDQINQRLILAKQKEAANIFLKEKTNALMEKYAALATTVGGRLYEYNLSQSIKTNF